MEVLSETDIVSTNSTKANLFCKEYASVNTLPKHKAADKAITLEARRALLSPCCCTTTKEELHPCSPFSYSVLEKLPHRSASGPDDISNTLLRNLSPLGRCCLLHPYSQPVLAFRRGSSNTRDLAGPEASAHH